jgi:hypothetical protein
MLSYNRMNNEPLHLANIDLSSAEISVVGRKKIMGCPRSFIELRMGRYE